MGCSLGMKDHSSFTIANIESLFDEQSQPIQSRPAEWVLETTIPPLSDNFFQLSMSQPIGNPSRRTVAAYVANKAIVKVIPGPAVP
jgi:hypothetical protein